MLNIHGKNVKPIFTQQMMYPSTSIPAAAPQQSSLKVNIQRSMNPLNKGISANSSIATPQTSQRGQHAHQSAHEQLPLQIAVSESCESVQSGNYVNSLKTIYMNNNNSGNLNFNRTNKCLTPVDYSEKPQKLAKIIPSNNVEDGTKYSFKFQTNSTGLVQQTSQSNMNAKSTKFYGDSENGKTSTLTPSYYCQQTPYLETQSYRIKGVKNQQQQQVQSSQHRSLVTNFPHQPIIPGKTVQARNTTMSSKYVVQRTMSPSSGPHQIQQIRYTTGPHKINEAQIVYNDVNISHSQANLVQSPLKVRTLVHQYEPIHGDSNHGSRIYTVTETPNPDNINNRGITTASPNYGDNYMIVNGTKITDEMSARILHDLAQRNQKYVGNNQNSTLNCGYPLQQPVYNHQMSHTSSVPLDSFNNRFVDQQRRLTEQPCNLEQSSTFSEFATSNSTLLNRHQPSER